MEWKVVNAISRDVERQHLNKILAEIKGAVISAPSQQTITNTVNTIIRQQPTTPAPFAIEKLRVVLQGDVAGQANATAAGLVVIDATVNPALFGIQDAPNTGQAFWRRNLQWEEVEALVPVPLSKTLTYDISDRLSTVTDDIGTKTFAYDIDSKLISITGSGNHVSKTFTYNGTDQLVAVTVLP